MASSLRGWSGRLTGARPASWVLVPAALLQLSACQADEELSVQSASPSVPASYNRMRTPVTEVDIGGTAADTVLMLPTAATRLTSGVIVVADPYVPAVRYFSPDGELIRSVGTKGEGPGEFQAPYWLQRCGADSVFAWDGGQMRVTVLDSAGTVVRQFGVVKMPGSFDCSPAGVFVGNGPTSSGRVSIHTRDRGPLMTWDRQGHVVETFGDVARSESRPLGKVTALAVSDSLIFVGTGDSAWVDVLDFKGRRVGGVAIGSPPRQPTAREYELAIQHQASVFRTQSDRELSEVMLRQWFPDPPNVMPPYAYLFVDPDEVLWAVTSFPWDSVTVLQAVTAAGKQLGGVTLPRYIKVSEIGRGYVLGTYESEDGVPHVTLYRIPLLTGGT
jgi:hypothetical protein